MDRQLIIKYSKVCIVQGLQSSFAISPNFHVILKPIIVNAGISYVHQLRLLQLPVPRMNLALGSRRVYEHTFDRVSDSQNDQHLPSKFETHHPYTHSFLPS
jgi:hypothetical protein